MFILIETNSLFLSCNMAAVQNLIYLKKKMNSNDVGNLYLSLKFNKILIDRRANFLQKRP